MSDNPRHSGLASIVHRTSGGINPGAMRAAIRSRRFDRPGQHLLPIAHGPGGGVIYLALPLRPRVWFSSHNFNKEKICMRGFKTLVLLFVVIALWPMTASAQLGFNGQHYNLNIIGHEDCAGGTFTDPNRHTIHVFLNYNDPTAKTWTLTGLLDKTNKIYLEQSFDQTFQVLDGNACDGDGARFKLPVNTFVCPNDDPTTPVNEALNCSDSDFTTYQIVARALGSPKPKVDLDGDGTLDSPQAIMTTCGIDNTTTPSQFICSTEN